jgi:asparagine synthase (glutamine-hydrolysing)
MVGAERGAIADCEHPVARAVLGEIPWHLFGRYSAGRSQLTIRTPYLDNDIVELAFRSPPAVRDSPESALRLIRSSSATLAAIPTDRGFVADEWRPLAAVRRMTAAMQFKVDWLHKEGLPGRLAKLDPILERLSAFGMLGKHKFLPYRTWFRRELADYVKAVASDPRSRQMPYCNPRGVSAIVADHIAGRRNCLWEINAILTLEAIDRLLLADTNDRTNIVESVQAIEA